LSVKKMVGEGMARWLRKGALLAELSKNVCDKPQDSTTSTIMQKSATFLSVLFLAVFLSACSNKQAPTPVVDGGTTGSAKNTDFGEIVPDGVEPMDWGTEGGGLEPRDAEAGIRNGMYNGREMVSGVLPSVYFGFDSSSISASERAKLQQAADYLEANPSHHLLIEGHCDWYGTAEYNLALGDRRAGSVSNYLGTLGITPLRIETLSKGSLEATSGLSKGEASEDRRSDLIILK
jgi:peptidoglycan-associated lipoprotein